MAGEAAGQVDIEKLHAASAIKKVKLDDLKIDRTYQRDPSQSLVNQIAENWDEVSSELLLISDRGNREEDGGLFIVNGQHRSLAARKNGIATVHARVIDLTDVPDPAAVEATFRLRTNVRMGDRPLERFKAQLRAGDTESHEIVKILERFDTEINEQPNNESGINAIVAVERLYRVDMGGLLVETLEVLKQAHGALGGKTTSSTSMLGTSWFILKHAQEADKGRLVEKLRDIGYAALDRKARAHQSVMGGSLWMNFYRAIVETYNDRLQEKSRLEWKMRGASAAFTSGRAGGRSYGGSPH